MARRVSNSSPSAAFWRGPELAVAAGLTALCLALPTHNPTGDAWYYAACSRWGHELWQPHHLLYNGVGWLWLRLLGTTGPAGEAALPWLQALNSLTYGGCLLLLGPLLRRAGARPAAVPAWLLAVGSTFGMLRFAVENEAYIQPLLLALAASLAWAQALAAGTFTNTMALGQRVDNQKIKPGVPWLLLAGLLAALACLLHQVMAWWWLGLLLGTLGPWRGIRQRGGALRAALAYTAPALLVPLAYALAAPPGGAPGVVRFALHDYLTGGAHVGPGRRGWLLLPLNLVRTLGQVHGNLWPLLRRWPLPLAAVAVASLALAVWAVLGARPQGKAALFSVKYSLGKQEDAQVDSAARNAQPFAVARHLRRTHGLIAALQLGFVALSAGNAEFMVMLPALAALGLAGGRLRRWPARRVAALGAALLLWNLAGGLVPARLLAFSPAGSALRAAVRRQPAAWFILLDPNPLRNQLHYFTGQPVAPPRVLGLAGHDAARFRQWLRGRLAAGAVVYTDALGNPRPLDRARLTLGDPAALLLGGFGARRVAVLPTSLGPYYLSRLTLPAGAGERRSQPSANASAPVKTGAAR